MHFRKVAARLALAGTICLMAVAPAQAKYWQCVPFAREVSGVNIHGNALTWWKQAKGEYKRGNEPEVGAVMSFAPVGKMHLGHVAVVSEIVSDREVLLTHANWSVGGQIEYNVRAVDVSDAGDWSKVRVWYAPIDNLGATVYPVNGFIYPDSAPQPVGGAEYPPAPTIASRNLAQQGILAFHD
ncbi:CHAP domain-containing protein [Stakelama marina]|uniref:CHAP domain-containing protein n=1 Tax=Stakelama marina TaxID=2826939 RepID=A0A8T4IGK6_9SPHN|nr:CHAP domain-containing protein [Stakelama marina]MBR0553611.1 CHAP domain-containing protein [Stakelama marina]